MPGYEVVWKRPRDRMGRSTIEEETAECRTSALAAGTREEREKGSFENKVFSEENIIMRRSEIAVKLPGIRRKKESRVRGQRCNTWRAFIA